MTPADQHALRAEIRDCIGETIPLRRRWVAAIMAGPVGRLLAHITSLEAELVEERQESARLALRVTMLEAERDEAERGKAAALGLQNGGALIIRQLEDERDEARTEAERQKRHAAERYWAWDRTNTELFDAKKSICAAEAENTRLKETVEGAVTWRPMSTAPHGKPIVVRHEPNKHTPHGWVGTITRAFDDPDEERRRGLDTILHYNSDALIHGFHGCWTGWMWPEEAAVLATIPPKENPDA